MSYHKRVITASQPTKLQYKKLYHDNTNEHFIIFFTIETMKIGSSGMLGY